MGVEKEPLGMSELGCADGCGWCGCKGVGGNGWGEGAAGMSELGCADGCGRRGWKGVGGNGLGEALGGDERAWMCGWLRMAWVQGENELLGMSELVCADGCDSVGRGEKVDMDGEKEVLGMSGDARTAADGVGTREKVEKGGEKGPLGMSERGCGDGCGRCGCKGVRTAADGVGAREWVEMGGDERARMRGQLRTAWAQGSEWK
eukprot:s240_g8.t1